MWKTRKWSLHGPLLILLLLLKRSSGEDVRVDAPNIDYTIYGDILIAAAFDAHLPLTFSL